jgi:A/G-specific adenine glycosylase
MTPTGQKHTSQVTVTPLDIRRKLLAWFVTHRRDLPWRRDVSPYSVWISEIMLQQTVVKTVIPFFERWLERFPNIAAIACADEREVLTLWEGLGYYSRARNIHRAARLIVQQHGGRLPDSYDILRELPGIGEYTAAAIMSLAFGKPYPVVDANARRVVSRVLALKRRDRSAEEQIRMFLGQTMPPRKEGSFNEAIMELGQTVCQSHRPLCESCPLKTLCLAFRKNLQDLIPSKIASHTTQKRSILLLLISDGRILARRKESGIFAGLWLLPTIPDNGRAKAAIGIFIGGDVRAEIPPLCSLRPRTHHYTRYAQRLKPVVYNVTDKGARPADGWHWLKLVEIDSYPFPSVYRRILDELRATHAGHRDLRNEA